MINIESSNSNDHYFLKNSLSFFHRYCDSGFRTKWCGFWVPPVKFLEYYAYLLSFNGKHIWLSPENNKRCIFNFDSALHEYNVGDLYIKENVFLLKNSTSFISDIKIENKSTRDMYLSIMLETAVNIREKHENWHDRKYNFFKMERGFVVSSKEMNKHFSIRIDGEYSKIYCEERNIYKDHYPNGELERCFIPYIFYVDTNITAGSLKNVRFLFSAYSNISIKNILREKLFIEKNNIYKKIKNNILSRNKTLETSFRCASFSLFSLLHRGKTFGILAGLPWFQEYWARDSFISILAFNNLSMFDISKEILEIFLSKNIPSIIELNGKCVYNFADTFPLFLISLFHYIANTRDFSLLKENMESIRNFFRNVSFKNGIIEHDPRTTWMDTIERMFAIDVQALWVEAFSYYNDNISKNLLKRVLDTYFNEKNNYFFDSLNNKNVETCNPIFLTYFGIVDMVIANKILSFIKENMLSKYGILTRSRKSDGFKSDAYHSGSIWGWINFMAACSFLRYNYVEEGINIFLNTAKDIFKNSLGSIFEVVDSDTSKLIGCGNQSWSNAMLINCVDEFIIGLRPYLYKNEVVLSPRIDERIGFLERERLLANIQTKIRIDRKDDRISINLRFSKKPHFKIRLYMDHSVYKIVANSKKFNGILADIKPEKDNKIECFFK